MKHLFSLSGKVKGSSLFLLLMMLPFLFSSCTYNKLVEQEEAVTRAWADVETQYQRRSDLIPNLVETAKGHADIEGAEYERVINARARATQVTIDPSNITPEQLKEFQAAQSEVSSALSRLLVVAEQYPDLKASESFAELRAQLEGTENRIAEARRIYNEAVQTYNVSVRRFPNNIWAMIFGFDKKTMFAAEAGTEKAPEVKF